jgi:hypothetical protein
VQRPAWQSGIKPSNINWLHLDVTHCCAHGGGTCVLGSASQLQQSLTSWHSAAPVQSGGGPPPPDALLDAVLELVLVALELLAIDVLVVALVLVAVPVVAVLVPVAVVPVAVVDAPPVPLVPCAPLPVASLVLDPPPVPVEVKLPPHAHAVPINAPAAHTTNLRSEAMDTL